MAAPSSNMDESVSLLDLEAETARLLAEISAGGATSPTKKKRRKRQRQPVEVRRKQPERASSSESNSDPEEVTHIDSVASNSTDENSAIALKRTDEDEGTEMPVSFAQLISRETIQPTVDVEVVKKQRPKRPKRRTSKRVRKKKKGRGRGEKGKSRSRGESDPIRDSGGDAGSGDDGALGYDDDDEGDEGAAVMAAHRKRMVGVEQPLRDLAFDPETKRVVAGVDDFVPGAKLERSQFDEHVARVRALKEGGEAADAAKRQAMSDSLHRQENLRQGDAAVDIQRWFRGVMGWRRYLQVKAAGGYKAFAAASNGKEGSASWREVYDARTGDVWYYNPSTGESQWELPRELGPLARVSTRRGGALLPAERPSTSGFLPRYVRAGLPLRRLPAALLAGA